MGACPSVVTGANLANRDLIYLGISGDGDSASIGLSQFAHAMRRGVRMVYVVENNGVYGLTKGQFSATADRGSKSKKGVAAANEPIDLCGLAIQLGATFVARSFSGDKAQLVPLIKAAFHHHGAAFLDVISPCVTFNNHEGSTKSFDYVREHNKALNAIDYVPSRAPIEVEFAEGAAAPVELHDGTTIDLYKLSPDHDCRVRADAIATIEHHPRRARSRPACCSSTTKSRTSTTRSIRRRVRSTNSARRSCAPARRRSARSTRHCAEAYRPLSRAAAGVPASAHA